MAINLKGLSTSFKETFPAKVNWAYKGDLPPFSMSSLC